jgi:hypothetical protein
VVKTVVEELEGLIHELRELVMKRKWKDALKLVRKIEEELRTQKEE